MLADAQMKSFQSHQSSKSQAAYKKKGKTSTIPQQEHCIKNIAKTLTFIKKLSDLRTKSI